MTKVEYKDAMHLAADNAEPLIQEDLSQFNGFGLSGFQQIVCTTRQLAALIRWQAGFLSGGFCQEALNEIWAYRKRFLVIG